MNSIIGRGRVLHTFHYKAPHGITVRGKLSKKVSIFIYFVRSKNVLIFVFINLECVCGSWLDKPGGYCLWLVLVVFLFPCSPRKMHVQKQWLQVFITILPV